MPHDLPGTLAAAVPPVDLYWAIEARWAQNALAMLEKIGWQAHAREFRAGALRLRSQEDDWDEDEEGDEREEPPPPKPYQFQDGVAILSLTGPMTKRPQSWGSGTSTVQLRRQVRQAAGDPDVKSIALVVDSPGGQLSGTAELAADVAAARKRKPVTAYIEDLGASAAYWVASQAEAIYANEMAFVGSIGTYLVVEDWSQAAENAGVKVHVVKAGEFKGAGYPGTPITEGQLADWQRQVDQANEIFMQSVAAGRGWSAAKVRQIADGRCHVSRDALGLGLIDGIKSFDRVLADLQQSGGKPAGQPAALGGTEEGASMSRMESFLAWLKGEGGEDEKPPIGIGAAAATPATLVVEHEAALKAEAARKDAEAQVAQVFTGVRQRVIAAGIRAGHPASLVTRSVDALIEARDWEGLAAYWQEADEAAKASLTPGTSADRGAATRDADPKGEHADPKTVVARYRGKHVARATAAPDHGKGRERV